MLSWPVWGSINELVVCVRRVLYFESPVGRDIPRMHFHLTCQRLWLTIAVKHPTVQDLVMPFMKPPIHGQKIMPSNPISSLWPSTTLRSLSLLNKAIRPTVCRKVNSTYNALHGWNSKLYGQSFILSILTKCAGHPSNTSMPSLARGHPSMLG
jgi:hypothetical protein